MLISEKGYIKLGDLGLAVKLESPTATIKDYSGTPSYLAPEQYDDKTCLKSDIWALGMSLVEIANGKHPYDGKNQFEVSHRLSSHLQITRLVCMADPPTLSSTQWSADFVDFVKQCLTQDVEKRPSAVQLMEVAMFRCCDT